jgi:hypothetical protein
VGIIQALFNKFDKTKQPAFVNPTSTRSMLPESPASNEMNKTSLFFEIPPHICVSNLLNHSSVIFPSINSHQLTMTIFKLLLSLSEDLRKKIYFMFLDIQNYSDWEAEQIAIYQNEMLMESIFGDGGWFDS